MIGVEPIRPQRTLDFESSASAKFRHTGITTKYILPSLAAFVKRPKAVTGIEPVMKVLQTSALPLGYTAIDFSRDIKYLNWGNWIRTSA